MDAANGEQLIFRVFFSQHFVNVKKSLRERSESVEHFGIRLFPFCGKPFFVGGVANGNPGTTKTRLSLFKPCASAQNCAPAHGLNRLNRPFVYAESSKSLRLYSSVSSNQDQAGYTEVHFRLLTALYPCRCLCLW